MNYSSFAAHSTHRFLHIHNVYDIFADRQRPHDLIITIKSSMTCIRVRDASALLNQIISLCICSHHIYSIPFIGGRQRSKPVNLLIAMHAVVALPLARTLIRIRERAQRRIALHPKIAGSHARHCTQPAHNA